MLRTLHKISSALLAALGVVHTTLTPVFYGRFTLVALWFAGSGLAMIFVGFLNITLTRDAGRDRLVRVLCYTANLLTVVFGFLIVGLDREPQVVFGLVLIILMTATAFMTRGARVDVDFWVALPRVSSLAFDLTRMEECERERYNLWCDVDDALPA